MATSELQHLLKKSRRSGASIDRGRFLPQVEPLDGRVLPAVTASYSPAGQVLHVVGDALDNAVVVSRDAAGTILVNDGAVPIRGGPATVASTTLIMMVGQAGNDTLSLNEANGALPAAALFGGDGDDVLTGGSGNDFIEGGEGDDTASLGAGEDTFQWDPGDGSDVVEGQGGRDTLVFNGTDDAEKFDVSADGSRVRFTRDVGNVTMDLRGIAEIDLSTLGGADTVALNDQAAAGLVQFNLDLTGPTGRGDGQDDVVTVNGTGGNDAVQVAALDNGATVAVTGLVPRVSITGADGTGDHLTVNTLGGDDAVDTSNLPPGLIGLTVNLGAGQAAATTTALRTSAATSVFGQAVVLTAAVTSPAGTPTGTVTFLDGNTVLGTAPLNAAGRATLPVSPGVGCHALTAAFGGNGDFAASSSSAVAETVNPAATMTALSPSANPAVAGQAVTLTATVTAVAPGAGMPTGTVTFLDDGTVLGTAAVGADGRATLTTHFAAAGGHVIAALYGGDGNFVGSAQAVTEPVSAPPALAPTTTALTASVRVARKGRPVTFTATVRSVPGAGTPTGTVRFLAGNGVVARVPLNAAGQASFTRRFAARGRFVIRAGYGGDGNFAASAGSITELVTALGSPLARGRHNRAVGG